MYSFPFEWLFMSQFQVFADVVNTWPIQFRVSDDGASSWT